MRELRQADARFALNQAPLFGRLPTGAEPPYPTDRTRRYDMNGTALDAPVSRKDGFTGVWLFRQHRPEILALSRRSR